MPPVGRILKAIGAAFGLLLAIWYRAVLATPEVKRRKAARRAARRRPS